MRTDHIHLLIQAGSGGNGCESYFRRTDKKTVPHGGDGGHGGSVIFRADHNAPPLGSFRYKQHLLAENGGHGGSNRKRGRNGKDLIILVPPGTRIYDRNKKFVIRDLMEEGEEVIAVQGARGGAGNQGGKQATVGEKGGRLDVELNIQILADIFLVGLPNSGKSRLLNSLTRAHVKEEAYPFATTEPVIGVHAISDYEHLTLCELPSLYHMSHEGRGRGTNFLKHLERARVIVYVLDPVSKFSASPAEGLQILRNEVKLFCEDFLHIPSILAVNKMDLPEAKANVKKEKFKPGLPVFYLSAVTGEGMEELKKYLIAEGVPK